MIKLVVSDADGTLINKSEAFISNDADRVIRCLAEKGIVFAVASGRCFKQLYNIMKENDNIYYICSDGGCVIYKKEVIYKRVIDEKTVLKYSDRDDFSFHETPRGGEKIKIIKSGALYSETPQGCYEIYRDKDFTEWIKNGASKGAAVEFIKKELKIKASETAVFGDNINDLSMLRCAGHKYIMKNSTLHKRGTYGTVTDNIIKNLKEISDGKGE